MGGGNLFDIFDTSPKKAPTISTVKPIEKEEPIKTGEAAKKRLQRQGKKATSFTEGWLTPPAVTRTKLGQA